MANQVLSLATFDQTKIRDFWPVFSDDMENPIKENWLDETFFKGKAALIVSRVGKNQYFAQPNTNFKNFAQKRLTGLRLQKTIVDQKGNPVFEIFTSVN